MCCADGENKRAEVELVLMTFLSLFFSTTFTKETDRVVVSHTCAFASVVLGFFLGGGHRCEKAGAVVLLRDAQAQKSLDGRVALRCKKTKQGSVSTVLTALLVNEV